MRRKARRDGNHAAIRDALRRIPGVSVYDASHLGDGMPDLIIARGNRLVLLEIKDPGKPPSDRKLTPAELAVSRLFPMHYFVALTLDDALAALGIRQRAPGAASATSASSPAAARR